MKIFKLTVPFCLFCISVFGQKTEKIIYSHTWGIMGATETLLIPQGKVYILQRNYLGMLGGTSIDTLYLKEGFFHNSHWIVTFTNKKMVLKFLGNDGWIKRIKFKEYDKCDPFIKPHVARQFLLCIPVTKQAIFDGKIKMQYRTKTNCWQHHI